MHFHDREEIIALTPLWKGERFPDGRPKVADRHLYALYGMTLEEVWKPIFVLGYENQFVGGGVSPMQTLHDDGRKLVGRAVTCSFCPTRPDLHELMFAKGAEEGRKGNYNQWVIDSLVERDVVVCDMYDKIYKGTFICGNLTTAIKTRTKTGGAVIWGGIRFEMITQNKFTTAQIDKNKWTEEMLDMLLEWIRTAPRGEEYRDLDWSKEYDLARNGDPNDAQTAL